ncbi:MAG: ribbon-helix-helix protein, CopG family [Spirochaetaceae bacterium]|nr:ribbon-helix-helix protein, CopG family [Spirochaetaceae bacterium]
MSQITARLPDEMIEELDKAARSLRRTRAEIVRQAIELYLEDYQDLVAAIDALRDPADEVLNWEEVRSALLDPDQE